MPYTVLVAEDNEDYFSLYARHVKRAFEGIEMIPASDGFDALRHLKSGLLPNLILVDINMPGMGGYDFLVELRKTKVWQHIPVVIWTSYPLSASDVVAFYGAGASSVMLKHDSMKDIKAFCQYWFEMVQVP